MAHWKFYAVFGFAIIGAAILANTAILALARDPLFVAQGFAGALSCMLSVACWFDWKELKKTPLIPGTP